MGSEDKEGVENAYIRDYFCVVEILFWRSMHSSHGVMEYEG
jgi:hypothetical protein